jgi:hypothetical protein
MKKAGPVNPGYPANRASPLDRAGLVKPGCPQLPYSKKFPERNMPFRMNIPPATRGGPPAIPISTPLHGIYPRQRLSDLSPVPAADRGRCDRA